MRQSAVEWFVGDKLCSARRMLRESDGTETMPTVRGRRSSRYRASSMSVAFMQHHGASSVLCPPTWRVGPYHITLEQLRSACAGLTTASQTGASLHQHVAGLADATGRF